MRTKEAYQRHGVFRFPRDSLENGVVVCLDGIVGSVAEAPPDALVGYGTEQANNERVAVDVIVYSLGCSDHKAAAVPGRFGRGRGSRRRRRCRPQGRTAEAASRPRAG